MKASFFNFFEWYRGLSTLGHVRDGTARSCRDHGRMQGWFLECWSPTGTFGPMSGQLQQPRQTCRQMIMRGTSEQNDPGGYSRLLQANRMPGQQKDVSSRPYIGGLTPMTGSRYTTLMMRLTSRPEKFSRYPLDVLTHDSMTSTVRRSRVRVFTRSEV